MFDQITKLVAAYRAKDWKTVLSIIGQLIVQGADLLPGEAPRPMAAACDCSKLSDADLCLAIENHVATVATAASGDPTKAGGGLLLILLPFILEMLKRFIPAPKP